MSIPVAVADLGSALADFGAGYLLTTSSEGGVKAVSAILELRDGVLRAAHPGRGSVANVGARPIATLLFPPREAGGFSLLVDGTAAAEGEDVLVTPTGAVLHKAAIR